jgi:hypothetical protein
MREAAVFGELLAAARIGNTDIRLDNDTRRAGVAVGGSPDGLNIWAMPGPEKISPMPAMLLVAGE